MKRIYAFLIIMLISFLSIFSCDKNNTDSDSSYYSDAVKSALKVLSGSFIYTISVGDWSNTTTITFLEQYNPPKKGTLGDGTELIVHGKYRIVYDAGETFEEYYNLSENADRIYSYFSLNGTNSIQRKDFRVVDDNTFQLKEVNSVIWNTYKRK